MNWSDYYERFYDWEESTQLRHLSSLTNFGPSSEVCELACDFFEVKSATRLIKKALSAGVRFTAEEVMDLDSVVDPSLMPRLIKNTSHPLTADQLDDFSLWLNGEEVRELAATHHIPLDGDGNVMTPDMVKAEMEEREAELEAEFERRELLRIEKEEAARAAEDLLLAKVIYAIRSKHRREWRKKRRENR